MSEEHKSYGYEDWSADKVIKNMRIMQDGRQAADIEETEYRGKIRGEEEWQ